MKKVPLILIVICALAGSVTYFGLLPHSQATYTPSTLRVGLLPGQSIVRLRARFGALLGYLSEETRLEIKFVVATDYSNLLHLFQTHQVDLARFGGFGFVQAYEFYDAEPLVMREVDTRFTSWFLVRSDSAAQNISDMKGKRFAFGSKLSTSGHLMPRYFMNKHQKIIPENYFSEVRYSGAHYKTVYNIYKGDVDLGVVNPFVVKTMLEDGRLQEGMLRLLWETPPYSDYVWTVHRILDKNIKAQLLNAFLALDLTNEKHKKILEDLNSSGFLPAGAQDFKSLKEISRSLGLLTSESGNAK